MLTSPPLVRWTQANVPKRFMCLAFVSLCHQHAERLIFLRCALTEDSLWAWCVRAAFPDLTITSPISEIECRCRPQKQSEFLHESRLYLWATLRSSDLSRPRRTLYRKLVGGSRFTHTVGDSACQRPSCTLSGPGLQRRITSAT